MAIPAEAFFLDPDFPGTLQMQIRNLVSEGILAGRFRPGERMPSSRRLATHLGLSRITVTLAYTDLVANGYLASRGRSGFFVAEDAPVPPSFTLPPRRGARSVDWQRALARRFAGPAAIQRPADWRRYPYPFIYGQADPRLFDHANWRLCALQALGQRDFDALTSDTYERDDPRLIEYILRHILPRRGIRARPEEILLTMGAQNALWLAAALLLNARRAAAIENPCYPALRDILATLRCRVEAVDVDARGLPPEALPPDLSAVFVTASHQCPTNATMPVERRRALIERAERDGFVIVEDDYEFEISPEAAPAPALKSLDESGSVVHVGSFSKSLFPGLRLGFLVAAEPFIDEARALRALMLRHPPGHGQRTAAYFLSLGHYDAQVTRMADAYRRRRATMAEALARHAVPGAGTARLGGSSAWLRAPEGVDIAELARRLAPRGVLVEPGAAFFHGAASPAFARRHVRLAWSSIEPGRIPEGIAIVAEEMREMAGTTGLAADAHLDLTL